MKTNLPSRLAPGAVASVAALVIGCTGSDDGDDGDVDAGRVVLSGAAQKGPLVIGSTVTVSPVDELGDPSGELFSTQIVSDLGDFEVRFAYRGPVLLEGSGFFYNEITGALSDAPITLRAYHEVDEAAAQAYLNLVTHLTHRRVRAFLEEGTALPDAISQAETELRELLGLGGDDFVPRRDGVEMNIFGGDDAENAYLLALSAIFAQVAVEQAGDGSADAELQELVNTFALEFGAGGQVSAARLELLDDAHRRADASWIIHLLRRRLAEIGSDAEMPDVDRALDSDGDGVPNADDACPRHGDFYDEPLDGWLCDYQRRAVGIPDFEIGNVVAGDVTGDGLLDLLLVGDGGRPIWLVPDPGGEESEPVELNLVLGGDFVPSATKVVDFDGDGLGDIIRASEESGQIEWHRQAAPGEFAASVDLWSDEIPSEVDGCSLSPYANWLAWVDVNGDGRPDLAGDNGGGCLVVITTDAEGKLRDAQALAPSGSNAMPVSAIDLTGDGSLDLVTAIREDGGWHVVAFLNDGSGGFSEGPRYAFAIPAEEGLVDAPDARTTSDGQPIVLAPILRYSGGVGDWSNRVLSFDPENGFEVLGEVESGSQRAVLADVIGVGRPQVVTADELHMVGEAGLAPAGTLTAVPGLVENLRWGSAREGGDCLVGTYSGGGETGAIALCPR